MNPQEFLILAEQLAGGPGTEAALRSAVSRAYYCVFQGGAVDSV